jgi:hypothetical protein
MKSTGELEILHPLCKYKPWIILCCIERRRMGQSASERCNYCKPPYAETLYINSLTLHQDQHYPTSVRKILGRKFTTPERYPGTAPQVASRTHLTNQFAGKNSSLSHKPQPLIYLARVVHDDLLASPRAVIA